MRRRYNARPKKPSKAKDPDAFARVAVRVGQVDAHTAAAGHKRHARRTRSRPKTSKRGPARRTTDRPAGGRKGHGALDPVGLDVAVVHRHLTLRELLQVLLFARGQV